MAITDYDTLAAEVKAWCARSDSTFSNRVETFVALTEDRIYNGSGSEGDPLKCDALRSAVMETTATVSLTSGVGALPSDLSSVRTVLRDGDTSGLEFMTPRQFQVYDQNSSSTSDNGYYTVDGTSLKITASYTGDITLHYYKKFTAISQNNKTNDLLTAHPLVYFQGCMFEAMAFLQDEQLALAYFARYRANVAAVNSSADSVRYGGGPLRIRTRSPIP